MKSGSKALKKLFPWASSSKKSVYFFDEGSVDEKELLGNKGGNLCELHRLGLPVPQGFIITTEACKEFLHQEDTSELNADLAAEIIKGIHRLEKETRLSFATSRPKGSVTDVMPLLLSVRSGAAVSMPGMMDTVLNLGINDELAKVMVKLSNNPRWVYDTYRRFLQMFGDVVLGIDMDLYERILMKYRESRRIETDSQLTELDLKEIVEEFKQFTPVPHDPYEQLRMAIVAVFNSWNSPNAMKYRDINNISSDLGTAIVIQSMVYGNMNDQSGSGVAFTRNPQTGDKEVYGDFLPNSEGEDVVAGIRNPMKLIELKDFMPKVFNALLDLESTLESHYRDVQDVEFLVQNNMLFVLQTRKAKRSPIAAVKIAVDMVNEKLITEREALLRLDPAQMNFFLHPMIDNTKVESLKNQMIGQGIGASSGAAQGVLVFSKNEAARLRAEGTDCILVREETSADDIAGMEAANGVVTITGGITSHAAVVMRGMGKPAVTGARGLIIDFEKGCLSSEDGTVNMRGGEKIVVDGSNGSIYSGEVPLTVIGKNDAFLTVLNWADKYKNLHVLANADTPEDAEKAVEFGADGIGLCRTEHMFFRPDRLNLFRRMILSEREEERMEALDRILPLQQRDFFEMFRAMNGLQITIRLLDPPIHEFLPVPGKPGFDEEVYRMSGLIGLSSEQCHQRIQQLQEKNPMLGCRGCRLLILHPEILEMQVKAIVGAALDARNQDIPTFVQIMVPLVFSDHELDCLTGMIMEIAENMCSKENCTTEDIGLQLGTMIETPRACIRADKIAAAKHISFVSFGSNDLTQLTFGLSRDDTQQFMPIYLQKHILAHDPFQTLDFHAVGPLIHLAVKRSREGRANIKIGLCGEHGADLHSVYFLEHNHVNYVSCSPFRIPSAKVAAAQSRIEFVAREKSKELELSRRAMHNFLFLY